MEYLPAEIQLKILQNLNYAQLNSFKQTSQHFRDFINKYEGSLARKGFYKLSFRFGVYGESKFKPIIHPLYKHLHEKWLAALDKQIPVFILNKEICDEYVTNLYFDKESIDKRFYCLGMLLNPQNINQFRRMRYWLIQVFHCVFEVIDFNHFIFNPEMVKLLFDDEEIKKLKFNCQKVYIHFNQDVDVWNFTLDHLVIIEVLIIIFKEIDTTEDENYILFKLLVNEGYRIPEVLFHYPNNITTLYNLLIKHLETSKDLSNIVAKIEFNFKHKYYSRYELIIRGEVNESDNKKFLYKITNIHDSKMIFSILWNFKKKRSDLIKSIEIVKI